MKTSSWRLAGAVTVGAMAATGAVACGASSRAATISPTVSGTTHHSAEAAAAKLPAGLRVSAAAASCAHVPAGNLSSTVTFHKRAGSGPATYTVQPLGPSSHAPLQTRALRVGAGAPSTINIVWHQQKRARGDVTLRIRDANGRQVALLHETGTLLAARCATS